MDSSNTTASGNKPTFFCTMCDLGFNSAIEHRQHLKSEWHIYKLRCRVAPPNTVIPPPSAAGDGAADDLTDEEDGDSVSDTSADEDNDDGAEDNAAPEFIPGQCLFCGELSRSLDANMAHMLTAHSLIIPYQDSLAVELETLMWYLHLVIHGYHECVLCGTRRNTLEAVQQHMTAKGHCRFDISGEVADFYELSQSESHVLSGDLTRPDETSLRLPSGKLLTHRSQAHLSPRPLSSRRPSADQTPPLSTSHETPLRSDTLQRKDRRLGGLALQLSRLSTNDRTSLAHLPVPEQRSALATRKKQLDKAQRLERRAQLHVDRLGNKTLMGHFKPDVPGRQNG